MRLDPFAGCRSILRPRGTYHVVARDATRCYCGSITVRLPERGVPLDGLLVRA